MMRRILIMTAAACLLACVFAPPAFADENNRVVPLFSDGRGNKAWVEVETAGGRTKATPFIAAGGEKARGNTGKLEANEKAAIPLPAIMRFVEDARKAFHAEIRPAAQAAAPNPVAARTPAAGPVAGAGDPGRRAAADPLEIPARRCPDGEIPAITPASGGKPPAGPDAVTAAATQPASPVAERRETAPGLMSSFGPPDPRGAAIRPPVAMASPTGR